MRTKIYVLTEPDGEIRYIGKTSNSLNHRLACHLVDARRNVQNHKGYWIRSLIRKGYLPQIQLIGDTDGNGAKEEIAWIKYLKEEGVDLVNNTNGGEGVNGCKWTKKQKEEQSCRLTGRILSKEHIEHGRLARLGSKRPATTGPKISIALKRAWKKRSANQKARIIRHLYLERQKYLNLNGGKFPIKARQNVSAAVKEWWRKRKAS